MASKPGARSARNIETRKKKARRAIPQAKATRSRGATTGARKRLKKVAAKTQNRRAAVKKTAVKKK